jgi:hypothetical protein
VGCFGLLFLLPVAAGCSGQSQGKVSGQVVFNGKPLPGGRVTFRPADPKLNLVNVQLDEQGNFAAVLPAGEVKVSVDNRELDATPIPGPGFKLPPGLPPDVKK